MHPGILAKARSLFKDFVWSPGILAEVACDHLIVDLDVAMPFDAVVGLYRLGELFRIRQQSSQIADRFIGYFLSHCFQRLSGIVLAQLRCAPATVRVNPLLPNQLGSS